MQSIGLDGAFNTESANLETRELAWELQQEHPDQRRIKYLMENDADLRVAMQLADLNEKELLRRPALKPLQLQRHLAQTVTG